ncbi:unnamed protein product [Rhodiola kirilowii]
MKRAATDLLLRLFIKIKPFALVVFLQFGFAGMDVLSKVAMNEGMSGFVCVVYRHAVATLAVAPFAFVFDKKIRPKMTLPVFTKIAFLGLLEPVIDQNLYYLGLKYTTATFAAALCNILPAITFVMACIFRLEEIKLSSIRTQAKILGTLATVAGAMIMTLVKGPVIEIIKTKGVANVVSSASGSDLYHTIIGALMIAIGCFCWAGFMILQAITLKTYPVELSLTAWICFMGTAEGALLALVMERGHRAAWAIHLDAKLLAAVYTGVFCSALAYYIQGIVMKERGPVFVTAFSPLSMVLVAIMGSFILRETLFMGRVIGAIVIVIGLYMVVWGKSKDYDDCATNPDGEEVGGSRNNDKPETSDEQLQV